MSIEFSVALLILFLTVILTVYNQRQASALRGVERSVQDFLAMQIRDRRARRAEDLARRIDPFEWLAEQVNAELEKPIRITEVARVVHEVNAVELRTESGVRVIASTSTRAEIMRFDRRLRSKSGRSAKDRVASFASRPLLGKSRWGWRVTSIERVMSQVGEFFDLEAGAVAERIGVTWDNPSRLWFYVVK
ncbi:MAG TPA: hypothetical protein VLX61_01080 [Anaerolineales bacterium]|nr:hypothetical protein [Anaerolineales bacterium]